MKMKQAEIDAIRARCDKATPAPWNTVETSDYSEIHTQNDDEYSHPLALVGSTTDDADFIANARTDIPALLEEVERLQAENELNVNYAEVYKDICDKHGENFRVLLDKAKALQSKNATLTKALEKVFSEYGGYLPHDMNYYIQKAKDGLQE